MTLDRIRNVLVLRLFFARLDNAPAERRAALRDALMLIINLKIKLKAASKQ